MTIDTLDTQIIELLRKDPRVPNKSLANVLGVAEATIASRLRGLAERKLAKVTAQRDVYALGFNVIAHIDVYVRGASATEVAKQLAHFDAINGIAIFPGAPQILLQVHTHDHADLLKLIDEQIASVAGVSHIETAIALDIVKYNNELAAMAEEA